MRPFLLVCAALVLMHSSGEAKLCLPPRVDKDSPYSFTTNLAYALVRAKEGLDRMDSVDQGGGAYAILVALKLQKTDYECAKSQVAPYAASSKKTINAGAAQTARLFQDLCDLNDELATQCRVLLDSASELTPATMAERQAKVQVALEDTWGLLLHAVILCTYAVVEVDSSTGKMSRLALTARQRDEVLSTLRSGFGKGIIGGMKEGQYPLEGAAAVLYQVIGNPQYQLRRR